MERLHAAMAEGRGEFDDLSRRLGDVQHRFEAAGGFGIEAEAKIVLTGLGFAPTDHARPIHEFSGGYRTRAFLGSLLLRRPDYLLLDEPTNHLDLEGISWLETYLPALPSALVVVSHDRVFLNRIASSIAELERGRIATYAGNYDAYRKEKDAARERARSAAYREQKREEEVRKFIDRFRYKATKARQVQDRIRMLEKQERTEVVDEAAPWGFHLPETVRLPRNVLTFSEVTKAYGEREVLRGVDLVVERGDRIALVGPNGCGKSTLLKIAAGLLPADSGDVRIGEKVTIGFASQHVLETLTPGRTVLEEMEALAPSRTQGELRSLLGMFQFSGDEVFKKVETLSGGEKSRVALARLVLRPGNLLLLDEPTNHLDLPAREALEAALGEFEGAVLFASHDRYFISRVAVKVAGFEEGLLRVVEGDYDAYVAERDRHAAASALAQEPASPAAREIRRQGRRAEAEARNARNRVLRGIQKEVTALEERIAASEERLREIAAALADPATYKEPGLAESLGREQKELSGDLAALMRRWEEASARLHESSGG